jgi:hypothetical protein
MNKYISKTSGLLDSISTIMLIIGALLKIYHIYLGEFVFSIGFILTILASILKTYEINRLENNIKKFKDKNTLQ